jgi:hypothetical protein
MAVSNYSGLTINNPQVGIQITRVTDTSADWPSVANNTYFYDKGDALVHYKDSSGIVLELFSAGGASGVFGIANTSGVYTFYATLTLAMAAATAGQTIEMFADVTESSVTAITLKNGVNINGNGHTYNYTAATGNCFIDNGVAVVCTISDLYISRTNYTSGSVYVQSSSSSDTDWSGSKINITAASGDAVSVLGKIRNIWVKVTGNGTAISSAYTSNAQFYNCYGESTGSGYGLNLRTSRVYNCTSISVSSGAYLDQSLVFNSILQSTSGDAVLYGSLYNCTVISTSGKGIDRASAFNSTILSTSGVAVSAQSNVYHNCVIRSSSANAVTGIADIYNSSVYTDTASVTSGLSAIANYYGCSLRTNWNNASGHLLTSSLSGTISYEIVNCFMQVANASAYIMTSANASNVKYANNTYKGSTTPINTAVVTQTIVNTQDNQGNILL